MRRAAAHNLSHQVEACLREADALGLTEAGIHLDSALIALRGHGLDPPDAPARPFSLRPVTRR